MEMDELEADMAVPVAGCALQGLVRNALGFWTLAIDCAKSKGPGTRETCLG
jgi:hypothetical protein